MTNIGFDRRQIQRILFAGEANGVTAGASGHSISLACEEYALNLPAIETYIGHSIPVSKYNPDALMTDLPKPLRLTRARPGNGPRRNGPPRNRRRSG